ncbi:hypothetical protein [Methylobacterium gnaphalii]|nr:hypothetical protein [Methylobacterium gnaphalii]
MPVPKDAPRPFERHPKHGSIAAKWTYRDAAGEVLGYACRFDRADGGKTYQPLTLFREDATGALKWKWKAWLDPRPLYGLDRLAARPTAPVVLCEGEKAADAIGELVPEYVGVTSPNGSKSAGKADWTALRGRNVVIWPDADTPGREYADAAARLILASGAASVALIEPPANAPEGWDAADALAEAWPQVRVLGLVAGARPLVRPEAASPSPKAPAASSEPATGESGKRGPGRPPWHDTLLALTADFELWHTPKKMTFASVPMPEGHRENWRLSSEAFSRHLSLKAFEDTGRIPSKAAIEETVRILEAKAIAYGPCRKEWLRVGQQGGNLYLDLGCDRWHAVEIAPGKTPRILESHNLPFVRPEGMLALPVPEFGSERGVEELRQFVNVSTETDFHLIVAWVLGAMRYASEYPLLILNGEQGTGKSTLSRILRSIFDPHAAEILAPPKEDLELFVLAQHTHLVVFDNLSKIEGWMSDGLCILATGGAKASRAMYTNDGLSILEAKRPVILNGIPSLADRPDLAQRSITVRLRPVPEEERITSEEIQRRWEDAAPRILGTFLEALSTGLKTVEDVKLDKLPRMAGFARFVVAAAPGLGLDGAALCDAYLANQNELADVAFDNSPVAVAVLAMMESVPGGEWIGTATQLLDALSHADVTTERTRNSFGWPKTPQLLGTQMVRAAPALRKRGIDARQRKSGNIVWEIRKA